MRVLRAVLIVPGILGVLIFPPLLPLWLGAIAIRRRRRGRRALPEFAFLSHPGRLILFSVGWTGLILVTSTAFAASISTSTAEHAAPVLGVFVIFGLFLIAAGDVAAQILLTAGRHVLRHARRS